MPTAPARPPSQRPRPARASGGSAAAALRELQRKLDATRRKYGVPGAAAGMVLDGRDVVATSGVTSVDNPLPITDHTLFMIGSTSKTFTATALMRLVEQGKVSLDDRVLEHLPEFKLRSAAATRALTVRNLVTHSGGWDGDIDLDTGWGDDAIARFVAALKTQPQIVPVNRQFSYNNSGFIVLGRIIEVLTGKTYEQAIADLVFAPLGMSNSFFFPVEALTRRFAVGHHASGRKAEVAHMWGLGRAHAPAGGVVSSVRDQLLYARFHMGDGRSAEGKRVLKASTLHLMQKDHFSAGSIAGSVGISWLISDHGGARTIAHGGNVSNLQLSSFFFIPSRNFALTVLTNSGAGGLLHGELSTWAREHFLGLRDEAPTAIDATAAELDQYAGVYTGKLFRLEVVRRARSLLMTSRWNISEEDYPAEDRPTIRKLLAQAPRPIKLQLTAADRAFVVAGPGTGSEAEFIRERVGGPVRWIRWGGRLSTRNR